MTRESAAAKADRLLLEGRLVVTHAGPGRVVARCRGEGTIHRLGYQSGFWTCSCPVRTDACSHLRALRRVTAPDLGARR
jgi:hypothetical protein